MKDPYIQKNGTLINLLGIKDYNELNLAEKDISYVKMLDADSVYGGKCDIDLIKKIHKHIFEDVYEWAGEFRNVPIEKTELIIPGVSLEYAMPTQIEENLKQQLEEMNSEDWDNSNINETVKKLTSNLAKIWRIHPFRDGNTRTTLTFASIFAKEHNINMNMATILGYVGRIKDKDTGKITRWSARDKFVLAALDEKDYPEPEHLEHVIRSSIINNENEEVR